VCDQTCSHCNGRSLCLLLALTPRYGAPWRLHWAQLPTCSESTPVSCIILRPSIDRLRERDRALQRIDQAFQTLAGRIVGLDAIYNVGIVCIMQISQKLGRIMMINSAERGFCCCVWFSQHEALEAQTALGSTPRQLRPVWQDQPRRLLPDVLRPRHQSWIGQSARWQNRIAASATAHRARAETERRAARTRAIRRMAHPP
jgi:hypothetical protein